MVSVVVRLLSSLPLSQTSNIQVLRLTPPFFFCVASTDWLFGVLRAPSQLHAVMSAFSNIFLVLLIFLALLCQSSSEPPQRREMIFAVGSAHLFSTPVKYHFRYLCCLYVTYKYISMAYFKTPITYYKHNLLCTSITCDIIIVVKRVVKAVYLIGNNSGYGRILILLLRTRWTTARQFCTSLLFRKILLGTGLHIFPAFL